MNKSEKERLARRQRMLAREQGQAPEAGIRGTSGDISLRVPKPVRRGAPPPKTPDPAAGETAARLKSLTPLYKQRQHRRRVFFAVVIAALAVAVVVMTGTLSASLALLGDTIDSAILYIDRTDGGWPATTGITDPLQIEPLAGGFVETCSSTRPTDPKSSACSHPTRGRCWPWAVPALPCTTAQATS